MSGILFCTWYSPYHEPSKVLEKYNLRKFLDRTEFPNCHSSLGNTSWWRYAKLDNCLWMQGSQPRVDNIRCDGKDNNILSWNGNIYSGALVKKRQSDSVVLCESLSSSNIRDMLNTLASIRGPHSIIYYKCDAQKLYFARDCMGRRSLLLTKGPDFIHLTLSSAMSAKVEGVVEVPLIGIFVFALGNRTLGVHPWRHPWRESGSHFRDTVDELEAELGIELEVLEPVFPRRKASTDRQRQPKSEDIACYEDSVLSVGQKKISENLNVKMEVSFEISSTENNGSAKENQKTVGNDNTMDLKNVDSIMKCLSERVEIRERIQRIMILLKKSVLRRVSEVPECCNDCNPADIEDGTKTCDHAKLGVLFSGGLDSTILVALLNQFVPLSQPIDLINVTFEKSPENDCEAMTANLPDLEISYNSCDKRSAQRALTELMPLSRCRTWNLVECNVPLSELQSCRESRIKDAVYPTVAAVDSDGFASALWFASRGSGTLASTGNLYKSPCRVLFSGLGANELFGGCAIYRETLDRGGWPALTDALDAELTNLSEKTLGTVDRIASNHCRQSVLPYLDDDLVEHVRSLPAWQICYPTKAMPEGLGDKLLLRLVARELELFKTANVPHVSMQLGCGIVRSSETRDTEEYFPGK